ncbi:MAG: porin [Planctomycetota bacterium]|nr:porin [Planctomycetota bacterium]
MSKAKRALVVLLGTWTLGAAAAWAGEPDVSDLARTVEALKARLRDQKRRIAELEEHQSEQSKREDIRNLVDEALGEIGPSDFRVYWDHGMRARTGDGRLKMKFGGRLMFDWTWIDGGDIENDFAGSGFADLDNLEDGKETRRAYLYWEGEWNEKIRFRWQYDWADGPVVKDLYLELKKLPVVGNLRMGHFKEPFSLTQLTPDKYITFIERASADMFTPKRNAGFMLHNHMLNKRVTWAAGLFQDTADDPANDQYDDAQAIRDGDETFTMRITGLPLYANDGKQLIHAGFGYSYRSLEHNLRYRQRPETHILPRFVNTGQIGMVDDENLFGAELAAVFGPFHIESEYMHSDIQMSRDVNQSDPGFSGWYVQVGYFLTGEHRPYKTSSGAFTRVKPKKNWDEDGPGAWEIAGRYSQLDLDDAGIEGGVMENYTLGLNWYLNPNVRMMWNYIHCEVEYIGGLGAPVAFQNINDDTDIIIMRLQVDF